MTEDEARGWLEQLVPRETLPKLERFVAMVRAEMDNQNLISAASANHIWARHVVDSAQLLKLASNDGDWIDIGSGAGFPGIIVAIVSGRRTVMIEPRPKRTAFLTAASQALGLDVEVVTGKAQALERRAGVISARAVAPAEQLFEWGGHMADRSTIWVLPKGRSARSELADAKRTWQGDFRVEASVTDPGAGIIVAQHVRRRR